MSGKHDILTKDDGPLLVTEFYRKATADALVAPFFRNNVWNTHLPHLVNSQYQLGILPDNKHEA